MNHQAAVAHLFLVDKAPFTPARCTAVFKPQRAAGPWLTQHGYTLPELLLGLTVSLLIIAAAISAYGTSKQTWNAMAAVDAIHANARVALRNLREQAQLAGAAYLVPSVDHQGNFSVEISASEGTAQAAIAGINGSKTIESVSLGHWHALDAMDCQGNTGGTHNSVRNDYKLNTNKELSCKDLNLNNSTYQAVAEGVEDFQVRYAEGNPSTQTIQWKTADQVSNFSNVLAFEVCVRLTSSNFANVKLNTTGKGCQGEALTSDGRVRRTFKRVIALRNRAGVMP